MSGSVLDSSSGMICRVKNAEAAVKAAEGTKTVPMHTFSGPVEHAIAHIEEAALNNLPEDQQRWYAIKIFERDDKVLEQLHIPSDVMSHIETDIKAAETELDDDAESIITNERCLWRSGCILWALRALPAMTRISAQIWCLCLRQIRRSAQSSM